MEKISVKRPRQLMFLYRLDQSKYMDTFNLRYLDNSNNNLICYHPTKSTTANPVSSLFNYPLAKKFRGGGGGGWGVGGVL